MVCSSTDLLPGSHSIGDSLPHRGRCLQKRKSKELRASPWDLGFCCMQQEAPYLLCVGGNTPCRYSFVPYKIKMSHRWAKSPYSHPVCGRNNSKLCGDWNFILSIGASRPYTEDDAPLEYARLMRRGMEEEFLCTESVHILVERRALRA